MHAHVMIGLPGIGKSTLRAKIIESFDPSEEYLIYSTDDYIENYAANARKTYNDVFDEAIVLAKKEMDRRLYGAIEMQFDHIIFDQTNLTVKKRRSILRNLPTHAMKFAYYIEPPFTEAEIEEHDRRLASRPGKNIPEHIMRSMTKSFTAPSFAEGFDAIFRFGMDGRKIA